MLSQKARHIAGIVLATVLFSIVAPLSSDWGGHVYSEYPTPLKVVYHSLWWTGCMLIVSTIAVADQHDPSSTARRFRCSDSSQDLLCRVLFWTGWTLTMSGVAMFLFVNQLSLWKSLLEAVFQF